MKTILTFLTILLISVAAIAQINASYRAYVKGATSDGASFNPNSHYSSISVENRFSDADPLKRTRNDFIIFPNPVLYDFTMELPSNEMYSVSILDPKSGKDVLDETWVSNEVRIDCSNLPAGEYYVRISNNLGVISKKIIKQ